MLTEWLSSGRNVLSIAAIGGMGKSALTWAWLQRDVLGLPLPGVKGTDTEAIRVSEGARPEGILWWSFYERDAHFANFVRNALHYASDGEIQFDSLYDELRALTALLAKRRLLLILDGFERELRAYAGLNAAYQGDEASEDTRACIDPHAGAFLQWITSAPIPSRVLLTTRLHPQELDDLAGCQRRDLASIDPEDAVHFFRAQGIKGTRVEIQSACAPYGYHPLALRLLAGVVVKDRRDPGDIRVADRYPITAKLKGKEKHHILQVAYDAMDQPKRELLSRFAAFRNPMSNESLLALNPFPTVAEFDASLDELIDRGLLFFDPGQARYDLHPVVRQHAYDRLTDKLGLHTRLRDYFAKVPAPEKIETIDDLTPTIELYHHTIRAGRYDEALKLYRDRLHSALYFRFGAYQLQIELLLALFPNGEDQPPGVTSEQDHSWIEIGLANVYSLAGHSKRAALLCQRAIDTNELTGDKLNLATDLQNVSDDQTKLGEIRGAYQGLGRSGELGHEVGSESAEAISHQELARLETYRGRYDQSSSESGAALILFQKLGDQQGQCIVSTYGALRALLMSNPLEAIEHAREARKLADVQRLERDIIRAEWLLGWSLIQESLTAAETHLTEALTRCRRINLVEFEPDILLAFVRWHRASGNRDQAISHAHEALALADRCEYRLVQADCHNLLARLALDANDRVTALHHATIGRERAWCDGPPFAYQSALDEAEAILKECGQAAAQS